ncbi:MAG: hypothetical protein AAF171_08130 [Cyanobacteria bacterium P01_A01_bin.116]
MKTMVIVAVAGFPGEMRLLVLIKILKEFARYSFQHTLIAQHDKLHNALSLVPQSVT